MLVHAKRYAQLATVALAALIGAVCAHAISWALGLAGYPDMALVGRDQLHLSSIGGSLCAAVVVAAVLGNTTSRQWAHEVVQELMRVHWPARAEVLRATWVVICTVAVCSVYLGFLDALWLWLTDALLGVRPDSHSAQAMGWWPGQTGPKGIRA